MFLGHEAVIHIQIYALCRSTCTKHDVVNLCVSRSLSPEVWDLGPHAPPPGSLPAVYSRTYMQSLNVNSFESNQICVIILSVTRMQVAEI